MDPKRSSLSSALVLALFFLQFAPLSGAQSAAAQAAPLLGTSAGQCNAATFIADITVPDGSVFNPGLAFVKTWRLKNTGACTWTSAYAPVLENGDLLGANAASPMPVSLAPGQTVDISVNMIAPGTPGHYRGNWKLRDASGVKFGVGAAADRPFWVDIIVAPAPTPTVPPATPGLNLQGTVRMNNAGLAGVSIYRSFAGYPAVLVATSGTDGKYKADFMPIPGQETITISAVRAGYGFEPVLYSWAHNYGYENKTLDFTGAPGAPGTFPGPGAAFDFAYRAADATWKSGAGILPYPGADGDARGFVMQSNHTTLEDGVIDDSPNLVVAPQNKYDGYIQGAYPEYTVRAGDRFRTSVGCAYGSNCYVTFRLDYSLNNGPLNIFWSWSEKNEGQVYHLDKDISSLAGKNVRFVLTLLAAGPATGDRAIWGDPRIVHIDSPVTTTVTPTTITATPTPGPVTVTAAPPPAPQGTILDFSNACSASWLSGAGALPCPGTDGDARGFVLPVTNPQLENGTIDNASGLLMSPQNKYNGYIQGTYPGISIQAGDRFQGIVNCAYGSACYVTFRLDYQIGNGPLVTFWSWMEKNEGQYYRVDKDLSALAGKNVKFVLTLLATGSAANDRAVWSQPRIVRTAPVPSLTATPSQPQVTGASAIIATPGEAHCGGPNPVDVSGTISTNGAATVTFHWEMRGDRINTTSDESIVFSGAGTQTIREGAYSVDCGNYSARLVITSPNDFAAITYYSIFPSTTTTPIPTSTPTPTAAPLGNVSSLTAVANVPDFVNCAGGMKVDLLGAITTDGPATVSYHWETGLTGANLTSTPETSLVFTAAATLNANLPGYNAGCGNYTARLVVTSPNPSAAQTGFSLSIPAALPIYDFSTFKAIGALACSDYPIYIWNPEACNGESGGCMVSQTALFGKSYVGFFRFDGNTICHLNLP